MGRFGHDKENRKGYPLIQIGLAVTAEEGIPIFHKTFPGNIHDSRTFVDISNDLMHLGIRDGIAVIDRGISSAENTAFLREKRWHVLCGLKRPTRHSRWRWERISLRRLWTNSTIASTCSKPCFMSERNGSGRGTVAGAYDRVF